MSPILVTSLALFHFNLQRWDGTEDPPGHFICACNACLSLYIHLLVCLPVPCVFSARCVLERQISDISWPVLCVLPNFLWDSAPPAYRLETTHPREQLKICNTWLLDWKVLSTPFTFFSKCGQKENGKMTASCIKSKSYFRFCMPQPYHRKCVFNSAFVFTGLENTGRL